MSLPTGRTALLVLDFQVGIADQPFAADALAVAVRAVDTARTAALPVLYSRVAFDPGYPDVAPWNPTFGPYAAGDLLPPQASRLVGALRPRPDEPVVEKNRFSPFAGSRLESILRSKRIEHLVVAGVTTSGVVLSTTQWAEDHDMPTTVLRDACADSDDALHAALVDRLFPRSSTVITADDWRPGTSPA